MLGDKFAPLVGSAEKEGDSEHDRGGPQEAEGALLAAMKNGDVQAGMLQSENDQEIVLQIPGTPLLTLKKSEIKSRDTAPSGMPPNMAELLTKREIRDLVEYVSSLK